MPGRNVVLVGQCGVDGPRIQQFITAEVDPHCRVLAANDEKEVEACCVNAPADLVLVNREMVGDFDDPEGVELLRRLREAKPDLKVMLVSDRSDAQQAAADAGALPGFGKADLDSPKLAEYLRKALH